MKNTTSWKRVSCTKCSEPCSTLAARTRRQSENLQNHPKCINCKRLEIWCLLEKPNWNPQIMILISLQMMKHNIKTIDALRFNIMFLDDLCNTNKLISAFLFAVIFILCVFFEILYSAVIFFAIFLIVTFCQAPNVIHRMSSKSQIMYRIISSVSAHVMHRRFV